MTISLTTLGNFREQNGPVPAQSGSQDRNLFFRSTRQRLVRCKHKVQKLRQKSVQCQPGAIQLLLKNFKFARQPFKAIPTDETASAEASPVRVFEVISGAPSESAEAASVRVVVAQCTTRVEIAGATTTRAVEATEATFTEVAQPAPT